MTTHIPHLTSMQTHYAYIVNTGKLHLHLLLDLLKTQSHFKTAKIFYLKHSLYVTSFIHIWLPWTISIVLSGFIIKQIK